MSDLEIIELYWARDEDAITQTAAKYGSYCHSISYNLLSNMEDAEECVNDTYHKAWSSMPPQRPRCLLAFLGRITRNLSLNRYQQKHAQKRGGGQTELALSELGDCVPAATTVEQIMDEKLLAQSISRFLWMQSEQKRNMFVRRYWYMDPVDRIAKAYGMTRSNTASLLYRMRCDLKTHLEKEGITL